MRNDPLVATDSTTTHQTTVATTTARPDYPDPLSYEKSATDTVAAITVAILAVVIILTLLLVCRAIRKRRRARQGTRLDVHPVTTISTGIMGTPVAAYANVAAVYGNVRPAGPVRWQSVVENPTESDNTQSSSNETSSPSQYSLPPPGSGNLDSTMANTSSDAPNDN